MTITDVRIPVHILTGFLGSGKTTLLREYLQHSDTTQTALIINEVGDIGIDHHLTQHLEGETVLLENGCLCCQVREDLKQTLLNLLSNDINHSLCQIIIETTGLANPSPILSTLFHDNELASKVRKGKIIATIDTLESVQNVEDIAEWSNQVSSADTLIFTKVDGSSEENYSLLKEKCRAINPFADHFIKTASENTLRLALNTPLNSMLFLPLSTKGTGKPALKQMAHSKIQTQAIFVKSVNWQRFSIWLSMLLYRYNDQILRVKGLLLDRNTGNYVLLNAVRKVLAPLEILDKESLSSAKLGLIFITRDIDPEDITRSFNAFEISLN